MTIDVQSLRSTIRRLEDDIAALRRIADAAEQAEHIANGANPLARLPPEIKVSNPEAVSALLRDRPALAQITAEMAPAIVREFAGEPSQVVLDLYEDPEIDDRYLVYYVRLPDYGDSIMDRLDRVSEQFERRVGESDAWVLVTTDYHPMS